MNYAEVFWNNIASLALIPIVIAVIAIVMKIKNAQIDSLKEQNQVLRDTIKGLELLRVGAVEEDFEGLKKAYQRKTEEVGETIKELGKKSLGERETELVVDLFERAFGLARFQGPIRPVMSINSISQLLYRMEGPIGELWRERTDGGKLWRTIQESEPYRSRKARNNEPGASI